MPDTPTILIAGRVIANGTRNGASGLRVELWAGDGAVVARALTDTRGGFTLEVAPPAGGADGQGLVVKVLRGTAELASAPLPPGATELALNVDPPPAEEADGRGPQAYLVRGTLREADGEPLAGAVVRAYNQAFRKETPLAVTRSGEDGAYEIAYLPPPAARAGSRVNLLVKVFPDGAEPIASPVRFNAGQAETIDLVAPAPQEQPSEYEQLVARLKPIVGDTPLADLDVEDVSFLTADQGLDRERVALLISAARHASETRLPAEALYGVLRQDQPTGLTALVSLPRETLAAALDAAVAAKLVPASVAEARDATLDRMRGLAVTRLLRDPEQPERPGLGALLDTMELPQAKQERLMGAYLARAGSTDEFWQGLRDDPEFKAGDTVDRIQLTLQLGQLTNQNLPLVQQLQKARAERKLTSLRDFARLDEGEWAGLIRAATVDGKPSVPEDVPGDTEDEKVTTYATTMASALAVAFPTVYLARQAARAPEIDTALVQEVLAKYPELDPRQPLPDDLDLAGLGDADKIKAALEALRREINAYPEWDYRSLFALGSGPNGAVNPVRAGVAKFFANAPDFDYGATTVDNYLVKNPAALKGIAEADKSKVVNQLKLINRVYQIASSPEQIDTLQAEGHSSARAVASLPRKQFIKRMGGKLGVVEAASVHDQARHIAAASVAMAEQLRRVHQDAGLYAIDGGKKAELLKNNPSLERLFGSLDMCDCAHCRSVYSASAYLVDLLHMLETDASDGNQKPLAALRKRRPDLEHILLTCENTETPLPYADLVNEILESYVASGSLSASTAKNTEDITAEELSVSPQYVDHTAYKNLSAAVYPLSLPFDRPVEVARAYLGLMGSGRHELMRTFQRATEPGTVVPPENEIAGEALGLTLAEWNTLVDATAETKKLARFYGYSGEKWVEEIDTVSTLLDRTGLAYDDLIALVKTNFLNPDGKLVLAADGAECDLDKTTLKREDGGPLEPTLSRLHRLVRLWRKLGWSIPELDKTLTALKAGEIDEALLQKLARVKELQAELRLPLVRLISLWSPIDTHGDDSLFRKLFQNKAVQSPPDPAFVLNGSGDELADPKQPIAQHLPAIRAALRVSDADLAAIRADAGLADPTPTADGNAASDKPLMTLNTLSQLFGYTALAKGLGLAIPDLIALKALSGIDPFADPAQTLRFVAVARKVKAAGVAIPELSYLFRHVAAPIGAPAPKPEEVQKLLATLHRELLAIREEHVPAPDPSGELLRAKLSLLLDPSSVEMAVGLVEGTLADSADQIRQSIADLGFDKLLGGAEDAQELVGAPLRALEDESAREEEKQRRREAALPVLLPSLRDKLSRDLIKQTLGDALKIERDLATVLLERALRSRDSQGEPLIADLMAPTLNGLRGTYTSVSALPGARLDAYVEPTLSFAWGRHLPTRELRGQVSEWAGQIQVRAATKYRFTLTADQAVTITIDGKPLTLGDARAAGRLFTQHGIMELAAGDHTVLVKPKTSERSMFLRLRWGAERSRSSSEIPLSTPWKARWSGQLLAEHSEDYTIVARTDDQKVEVKLDGAPLAFTADEPAGEAPSTLRATTPLEAGRLYTIEIQYTTVGRDARFELRWASPSTPLQVIPERLLYPDKNIASRTRAAYTLLHKAALLAGGLHLSAEEVAHFAGHGADFADFDLNTLPLDEEHTDQAPALFAWWLRLAGFAALRDSLPLSDTTLIDVFAAAASADGQTLSEGVIDVVLAATGWEKEPFDELVGGEEGFALSNAQLRDETWLLRLQACLELSRRLGVAPAKLFAWAAANPSVPQAEKTRLAQEIVLAAKARYDEETWLAAARPVSDGLRERQRDALVAYVMDKTGYSDSNRLFEHFLIDVNMNACMVTSRIKQAIASVQLFVQRCLMDLEPEVAPEAIDARQWRAWRQRYRVWEANRKVFLYPENWVEPELRDDKSPFFKELETELLQSDLTNDMAEQALMSYLRKLDEVARLEVCGLYVEEDGQYKGDPATIHHIFGRTYSTPRIYYYRRLIQNDKGLELWTPWERVNVDIEGDHLVPIVYNQRLYLFWPIFKLQDTSKTNFFGYKTLKPIRDWRIAIAWSEYKHGRWSAKRTSEQSITSRALLFWHIASNNPNKAIAFDPDENKTLPEHVVEQEIVHEADESIVESLHLTSNSIFKKDDGTKYIRSAEVVHLLSAYLPDRKYHVFNLNIVGGQLVFYVFRRSLYAMTDKAGYIYPSKRTDNWTPEADYKEHEQLHKIHQYLGTLKFDDSNYSIQVNPVHIDIGFDASPAPKDAFNAFTGFEGTTMKEQHSVATQVATSILRFSDEEAILHDIPNAIRPYTLIYDHTVGAFAQKPTYRPCFYQDGQRTFAVLPDKQGTMLRFVTFYHPYVRDFIKDLNKGGISNLLTLVTQRPFSISTFKQTYSPNEELVSSPYPYEGVEFGGGAYALYNWELFFHIPLLIATRLSQQQRFVEAQRWFHYIFDPTDSEGDVTPDRYWKVLPFYKNSEEEQEQIENLLAALTSDTEGIDKEKLKKVKENVERQIVAWEKDPFKPHLLARMRFTAYQKTVVMKYIDNLIAWGDQLFRQDTIEAINEATQLYVLAGHILGSRPRCIPPQFTVEPKSFKQLQPSLDRFSNASVLVWLETAIPWADESALEKRAKAFDIRPKVGLGLIGGLTLGAAPSSNAALLLGANATGSAQDADAPAKTQSHPGDGMSSLYGLIQLSLDNALYFGIPQNEKLLGYWDTVADRLFKIRNCMNIEGVMRQLPLFEPPIDPAMLVRAAAAGVDLSSVLNDMSAPLPHYRFGYLVQKALELAAEVRSLGAALLAALEKKDAEALSALRAGHETSMLKLLKAVKVKQVEEANANKQALEKTRAVTEERHIFYKDIEPIIEHEKTHLSELAEAQEYQKWIQLSDLAASEIGMLPEVTIGVQGTPPGGGPVTTTTFGRGNAIAVFQAISRMLSSISGEHAYSGNRASTMGAWKRREEEWKLQERLAAKELAQIDQQLAAADIRIAIAETDLANHEQQIENAQSVEEFLRGKYTNEELYGWMSGEIAAVFFQSYRLAYDMAKRAERAFQFERGLTSSNFIQYGYWDSMRKGLLSGERLYLDLKRLELAYLDQNRREYELTRQISLLQLDPLALIKLKETGQCEVELPEALFDLDYPGHYMRRVKSVSLTIPCVTGPYTGVNCTLTLLKSRVRVNANGATPYEPQDAEDSRFVTSWGAVQSIATSHAQNDSGLFELNFRDERYLPFEGAGAVSTWRISMPRDCNAFDFDTITDVVVRLSYTAREGGAALAKAALGAAQEPAEEVELTRLFSARHEFPSEWYRFLHPTPGTTASMLSLPLTRERFPFRYRQANVSISVIKVGLYLKPKSAEAVEALAKLQLASAKANGTEVDLETNTFDKTVFGLPHIGFGGQEKEPGTWELAFAKQGSQELAEVLEVLDDLLIAVHYTVTFTKTT